MNVNDIIYVGATPVSFVDCIAPQDANPDLIDQLSIGLAVGALEGAAERERLPSRANSERALSGYDGPPRRGPDRRKPVNRSAVQALTVFALLATAACTSATGASTRADNVAEAPTRIDRTLVLGVGRGPESLGSKPLRQLGGPASPTTSLRTFNAGLALNDSKDNPMPYLAEALPQLNTETWRVSPDGRMETTYRLLLQQYRRPLHIRDRGHRLEPHRGHDHGGWTP